MGCGLLPAPSCALPRHAGVGSREQAQPPFPLRGGRPPGPGGAEGRACGAPAAVGAGGGGGVGGGAAPRPPPGLCGGGGGVGWGGPFGPLVMPLVGRGGGGRGRHGGPGPGGKPSARGSRPSPAPPIESWMPAQALAGALTSPAVAARRRPAGGG